MLSSKTGLSLNMAGHYPGGHKQKQRSDRAAPRAVRIGRADVLDVRVGSRARAPFGLRTRRL